MIGVAGSVSAAGVVAGLAATFVAGTIIWVVVLMWLLRKLESAPEASGDDWEPPAASGDDWESFEQQFAAYVAAQAGRRRGFPARP
jgi:hypothetical protein